MAELIVSIRVNVMLFGSDKRTSMFMETTLHNSSAQSDEQKDSGIGHARRSLGSRNDHQRHLTPSTLII